MADRWVRLICQIKRASSPQPSPPSDGGEGENQSLMQPWAGGAHLPIGGYFQFHWWQSS